MCTEEDIHNIIAGIFVLIIGDKAFKSKFIVWVCLCVFTALLASRLDGDLDCSFWYVATPIWIWKGLAILGALIVNIAWFAFSGNPVEKDRTVYKSMMMCVGLYLMLLIFEYLAVNNLESDQEDRRAWVVVFIPLVLTSLASCAVCIWDFKHDISCELELLISANVLQFIFIALRLDEYITWPWEAVLIPAWILLSMAVLLVLFTIIMTVIIDCKKDGSSGSRPSFRNTAAAYSGVVVPLIISAILLAVKLNGGSSFSFSVSVSPLYISYIALIGIPCKKKKANQWWFDLMDMWQFMLKGEIISQAIPHDEEEMLNESPKLTSPEQPEIGSHSAAEVEKGVGSSSDQDDEAAAVVPPE